MIPNSQVTQRGCSTVPCVICMLDSWVSLGTTLLLDFKTLRGQYIICHELMGYKCICALSVLIITMTSAVSYIFFCTSSVFFLVLSTISTNHQQAKCGMYRCYGSGKQHLFINLMHMDKFCSIPLQASHQLFDLILTCCNGLYGWLPVVFVRFSSRALPKHSVSC